MDIKHLDPRIAAAAQIISDEALATLARINKTTPAEISAALATPKGVNQALKLNFLSLIKTGAALVEKMHNEGLVVVVTQPLKGEGE